jgi:hypothetical protein
MKRIKKCENLVKQPHPNLVDPILTTEELTQVAKASRRTIQKWRDHNVIEFSAVNGKFYYRMSAVDKMLNNHLQKMEG